MIRIFFLLFISTNILFCTTNIDKKIQKNKQILSSSAEKEETTSLKIKELAEKIEAQNSNIITLEKDIKQVNSDIDEHLNQLS